MFWGKEIFSLFANAHKRTTALLARGVGLPGELRHPQHNVHVRVSTTSSVCNANCTSFCYESNGCSPGNSFRGTQRSKWAMPCERHASGSHVATSSGTPKDAGYISRINSCFITFVQLLRIGKSFRPEPVGIIRVQKGQRKRTECLVRNLRSDCSIIVI